MYISESMTNKCKGFLTIAILKFTYSSSVDLLPLCQTQFPVSIGKLSRKKICNETNAKATKIELQNNKRSCIP